MGDFAKVVGLRSEGRTMNGVIGTLNMESAQNVRRTHCMAQNVPVLSAEPKELNSA